MRLIPALALILALWIPAPAHELFVAFWNVENLFDTVDDPRVELDEEFTPTAAKEWTQERYEKKLQTSLRWSAI